MSASDIWSIGPGDPLDGANSVEEIAARVIEADQIPREGDPGHLPPEYSEDALALDFTREYGDALRYVARWNKWFVWDRRAWREDTILAVYDRIRRICRAASSRRGAGGNASLKIASAQTVAAVERLARSDPHHAATTEQWDANRWLLNTPAGVVDLCTGKLRDPRPNDYMTKMTAVAPRGNCDRWQAFLARITDDRPELQRYLQRLCGYALTGITQEQIFAFFYGTGANGKSVFLSTVSGIMGSYAQTAGIEMFTDSKNDRHPTELAGLQGARLVTAIETEAGRRWAEAKLKSLTGGDPVSARFMRQDFFVFQPQFKLIIAGNHKPGIRTVDEAMRRRIHLVPFVVTVPAEERDPKLMAKLREEWPGILTWMIEGCLAWQAEGLNPPSVVTDETTKYLKAEDVLAQWIEDRCRTEKFAFSFSADLFSDWKQWADDCGEYAGSHKRFSENLATRGFVPERIMKGRGFRGICLKNALMTDLTDSPDNGVTRARVRANTEDPSDASYGSVTPARLLI